MNFHVVTALFIHSLSQSGQAIYSLHPSTLAQWHSTVIIAAAELLLITKKETSYERGENPTPYVWDIYAGHDNVISIRISCVRIDKHSNQWRDCS